MSPVERFLDFVCQWTGIEAGLLRQLLATLLIVLAYVGIRLAVTRLIGRRMTDLGRRYVVRKLLAYGLGVVGIIALVNIWVGGVSGMATYLGLLSAGLVFVLGQPLASLAGWFHIVINKPFSVGDRVQIGPHTGDVVDISLLRFTMVEVGNWVHADQSTGRIIHIPNAWVFSQSTANYTQGFNFIWNEIAVGFTLTSNWPKAKDLLAEIGRTHSAPCNDNAAEQIRLAADRFLIHFEHLAPAVWTSVQENGVVLTLRYLCHPRQRRSTEAKIWEDILRALPDHPDLQLTVAGGLAKAFSEKASPPAKPS